MILAGLIKLLKALLLALIAFLPDYTPPEAADLSAFSVIAWLVPVNEVVVLASVMVGMVVATLTFAAVNWTVNKVRGSG